MDRAKRNSSTELLRIILMFFIVFLHLLYHSRILNEHDDLLTFSVVNSIRGFLLVAVNCYVLISGYYGIRFKLKGLFRIYLICFIYGLLGYLIHLGVDGQHLGRSILYNSLFCISNSRLWFVKCYFVLYCLAPVLNRAIDTIGQREYIKILILLTLLNIYFGYFWGGDYINADGFNVFQFIYLYFIGGYLRNYVSIDKIRSHRKRNLFAYISLTVLWSIITIISHQHKIPHWYATIYNNPLILIGSIFLFVHSIGFTFKNRAINKLAASTFAVYVIHEGCYFKMYLQNGIKQISDYLLCEYGLAATLSSLFAIAIIILAVLLLVDIAMSRIIRPLWPLYDRIESSLKKKYHILIDRII